MSSPQIPRPEDFEKSVLGFGIKFPFEIDVRTGGVKTSQGRRHVKESIKRIVMSDIGDYPGEPDFGSGIPGEVFKPMSASQATRITIRLLNALDKYEPRIKNVSVRVTLGSESGEKHHLYIMVRYDFVESNEADNLVLTVDREAVGFNLRERI